MEQRLSLVTLGVTDVSVSRHFYEDLGWKASSSSQESVVFFQLGCIALALFSYADLAKDALLPGQKSLFGGITLAYNTRSMEEVDSVLQDAKAAGGCILKPAGQTSWGGYAGYFADPDGHPWEVAWNPFFPLSDVGAISLP